MKKILTLSMLLIQVCYLFAQNNAVTTDIFGDLIYRSRDGKYESTLKKNIFNDLVFTDNRKNSVTFESKYLGREYPGIQGNRTEKTTLLMDLTRQHRRSEGYVAKYSIDIFGKLTIEDNKGYKLEKGTDIFGHEQVSEQVGGVKTSLNKTLNGTLEYAYGSDRASLQKDIFKKWIYKDSFGNEIQFNEKTWSNLKARYQTDEDVFMSLIDQFFYR